MNDRTVLQNRARRAARELVAERGTINETDLVVDTIDRLGEDHTDREAWEAVHEAVWTAGIEFVVNRLRLFVHSHKPIHVPTETDDRLRELWLAGETSAFHDLLDTLEPTEARWYRMRVRDRSLDEAPTCLVFLPPVSGVAA